MIVLGKGTAKPTERSFKGKGVGDFRGIVRFWKVMWSDGRCGNPSGSRPNKLGYPYIQDRSSAPLTREASLVPGKG